MAEHKIPDDNYGLPPKIAVESRKHLRTTSIGGLEISYWMYPKGIRFEWYCLVGKEWCSGLQAMGSLPKQVTSEQLSSLQRDAVDTIIKYLREHQK